jgi:predicted transcriptional regulator YdeE
MNIQNIPAIDAVGFSVRTTNANEQDPTTAKLGPVWEKFFTVALPKLSAQSKVYGVYTNYESDHTGAFDVIACANTLSTDSLADSVDVQIEAGKYMIFSAQGQMPQAVIGLWGEVWGHFSASDCKDVRSYTTDFEFYKGANEVDIYIAIK